MTMDGDLQNDPEDIPRLFIIFRRKISTWFLAGVFIEKILFEAIFREGAYFYAVFYCVRWYSRFWLFLKIYKRECFEGLRLYGEENAPFYSSASQMRGFRVESLPLRTIRGNMEKQNTIGNEH